MSTEFLKSAINDAAKNTQREIEAEKAEAERKIMLKKIEEEQRFKKATNFILKIFAQNKSLTIEELKNLFTIGKHPELLSLRPVFKLML